MFISDGSIVNTYTSLSPYLGKCLHVVEYDASVSQMLQRIEPVKKEKNLMWIQADDAHAKLVNLANANQISVQYTGAHGYKVTADMIGGNDVIIKLCATEKEADDYVKDLLQQLL